MATFSVFFINAFELPGGLVKHVALIPSEGQLNTGKALRKEAVPESASVCSTGNPNDHEREGKSIVRF